MRLQDIVEQVRPWFEGSDARTLPLTRIKREDLYDDYSAWAIEHGLMVIHQNTFGKVILMLEPNVSHTMNRSTAENGDLIRKRYYVFPKTKRPAKPTREIVWSDEDLLDL